MLAGFYRTAEPRALPRRAGRRKEAQGFCTGDARSIKEGDDFSASPCVIIALNASVKKKAHEQERAGWEVFLEETAGFREVRLLLVREVRMREILLVRVTETVAELEDVFESRF
jgi:hypothetical protein